MDYITSDTALLECILFSQAGDHMVVIFLDVYWVSSIA